MSEATIAGADVKHGLDLTEEQRMIRDMVREFEIGRAHV